MGVIDSIYAVFLMLGGLAVFMFGMKIMGDSLERVAGSKMRNMLGKVTNNRFAGVGIGAGVTALIQSSSATTVMLVGFVNIGILTLTQATAVIMGANIGTTITAQIASLSAYKNAFNITAILSLFAVVGVFMNMFSSKDGVRRVGMIMAGLGMIFIGLDIMSNSMNTFREIKGFQEFLQGITNPFVLILIGTAFTAVIQSSSAATGIIISMLSAKLLTITPALYFVLGTNIGTCITAVLASIGSNVNGKRTAFIHLMFNVIGTIVFTILLLFLQTPIVNMLVAISGSEASRQLANFHTIFNVAVTLLLLPFVKILVKVSEKLIGEGKKHKPEEKMFEFIDERILETPFVAVSQTVKEVIRMNNMSRANLDLAFDCMFNFSEEKVAQINKQENTIDYLNRELTAYLVNLSSMDISATDEKLVGSLYHVISDIERIGDYATNLSEYAETMNAEGIAFSEDATQDVRNIYEKVQLLYRDTMYTFEKRDAKMLPEIARREQEIDELKIQMGENHVMRLNKGLCSARLGALYLSLASNLERVADHLTNIAYSIKNYTGSMNGAIKTATPVKSVPAK